MSKADTIYALSTGTLPSGIAVIRISGPKTRFVLETICDGEISHRKINLTRFVEPNTRETLDTGLVAFFQAPNSFTGEDVGELNCHGGRATIARLLKTLSEFDNVRAAIAGEFTKRAFYNGKMDLVEVEGLADLLQAETESQRKLAQYQLQGSLSKRYEYWRSELIRIRAYLDAEFDFSDEEDVPGSVSDLVWSKVNDLSNEISGSLDDAFIAERIKDGIQVVLVGPPNSGKSSLLNYLAEREVAIVSEEAGTTRDVLEVNLDIGGMAVTLSDTAGIRETKSKIEAIGIDKAHERITRADLVLNLVSPDTHALHLVDDAYGDVWSIYTKSDLLDEIEMNSIRNQYDFPLSVADGMGIGEFRNALLKFATAFDRGESLLAIQQRHSDFLRETLGYLKSACNEDISLELRAEELRLASDALGRITGRVDVEDLLDVIFRDFCIGK